MITEAQLDRALYVFNDVSTDAPRKSVREALREAIEATAGLSISWSHNMDAAPKDGTRVLAWLVNKAYPTNIKPDIIWYYPSKFFWSCESHCGPTVDQWTPTAWLPLPSSPYADVISQTHDVKVVLVAEAQVTAAVATWDSSQGMKYKSDAMRAVLEQFACTLKPFYYKIGLQDMRARAAAFLDNRANALDSQMLRTAAEYVSILSL